MFIEACISAVVTSLLFIIQNISKLKIEPKPDAQNCVNALTFLFRY